jgi:serine/threonine protein kinase
MSQTAHTASSGSRGTHAGRVLGGYGLISEMAKGGMASVYLAADVEGDGRHVAVKVMHDHLVDDPALLEMFFDEARIGCQIDDINVARVIDYGSEDDVHFLVMEYVLGETWQRVLGRAARQKQTGSRIRTEMLVAHVIRQTALGLHAAHESLGDDGMPLHVVHRDVSPQNLMVGYDGCVRVLDFGVAKANSRSHQTEDGVVKGRFAYMAPEQMRGWGVDRRADVWSLGVLLWEGLTHRRLFRRATDAETILATGYAPIPDPTELNPSTPPELAKIALRALQRDRDARQDSTADMAEELGEFLEDTGSSPGAQTLRRQMRLLFGSREDDTRRSLEQVEAHFASAEQDHIATLRAQRIPKRSGTRRRPPRARRLTESEYPTLPRSRPMWTLVKRYGTAALIVASGASAGLGLFHLLAG